MISNKITHFKNNSLTIRALRKLLFVGLSVLCFVTAFYGQTNYQTASATTSPNVAPGTPIGSYAISGFESVNPYSGKINFSLPLLNVGGRGNGGYTINLRLQRNWSIDHRVYDPNTYREGAETYFIQHSYLPTATPDFSDELSITPGIMKGRLGGTNRQYWTCGTQPCYDETLTRLTFAQSDGSEIEFRDVLYGGAAIRNFNSSYEQSRGTHWVSTDGTNATFISDAAIVDYQLKAGGGSPFYPSGTLYLANGTRYLIQNGSVREITDVNGNKTSLSPTIKDSLGREISYAYSTTPTISKTITYKGTNGAVRSVKINYASLESRLADGNSLESLYGLFAVPLPEGVNPQQTIYNPPVAANVELPDGRKYEFKYNRYGELAEIKLPTGGRIEYVWQANSGLYDGGGTETTGNNYQVYRRVEKRRVYENNVLQNETLYGTPSPIETFITVKTYQNTNGNLILVNESKHYYTESPLPFYQVPLRPTEDPFYLSGKELKTEIYDEQGTLLRSSENTWEAGTPLSANLTAQINARIAESKETLADANLTSKKTFAYDSFNNQTDIYEYDYGTGAAGAFKRRTHTDYVTDANYTSHTGAHLRSLPIQTWISSDAAGSNKASLTQIEYDNYAGGGNYAPLVNRSNVVGHDAANYGASNTRRGNVTKITTYGNAQTQSEPISAYSQYDILGNIVKTIDAKGYISAIDYTDRFGTADAEARTNLAPTQLNGQSTFAFSTSATNALSWVTGYSQIDYFTGQAVDSEDINGNVASIFYNDLLDRPTQAIAANNRPTFRSQQTFIYDEATRKTTATADLFAFGDNLSKVESFYDTLGRTTETRRYKDGGYVVSKTEYDALGRSYKQSNPYRPHLNETAIWTTTFYDPLGRMIKVKTPDNAEVITSYAGNAVTVIDQAGKQRRSITNALGQLSRIDEPNDVGQLGDILNPTQPTFYGYDTLNNLTAVQQGEQTRSFVYDSLSRLKQVQNPESGLISYQYDANSNLTQKTDARNIQTSYSYDALNRVLTRNYSDATPQVSYTYDDVSVPNAKGRLTKVSSLVSSTEYTSFDVLGKILAHKQTTDGQSYTTGYVYNLSGAVTEQTYPSGRVVRNVLDMDGDLSIVQSKKNQNAGFFNYAKNFTFTAAGAVSSMQLGNGKWESTQFNSRLQPTQIALGTVQNGTDQLKFNYDYGTTNNNGNVLSQQITVPTVGSNQGFTAIQSYTYDSLNRLKSATETIGGMQTWKQTFTFDRFGNRRFDQANTTVPTSFANPNVSNPQINTANNRFTTGQGYVYDLSGNVITDAEGRSFNYDAENKQKSVTNTSGTIGTYFYDGDEKRVKKISATETVIFVYNAVEQLVAEYSTQISQSPQVSYLTNDTLGTPRINTDASGNVIARHDYMPFGEEIYTAQRNQGVGYQDDSVKQGFTGYIKDDETNLDFAQARMYANNLGRFTTVDPLISLERIGNPMTWNRYQYVLNNPLQFIDPDGQVERDPKTGEVIFHKTGVQKNHKAVENQAVRKNGKEIGKMTISHTREIGYVKADDGTKIEAFRGATDIKVTFTSTDGKEITGGMEIVTQVFEGQNPEFDLTTNCHGTTFADGKVWINNGEVEKLMKGDGYNLNPTTAPQTNDVGIYSKEGTKNPLQGRNPDHSVKVNAVNKGNVTSVTSKGGIEPLNPDANPKSGRSVENTAWRRDGYQISYYSKKK